MPKIGLNGYKMERIFKRKLYNRLLEWKRIQNGKSAILIEGARRVGKSTLVEQFAKNEYESLFEGVLSSFGVGQLFNTDYWKYVCCHSACYYISYSVSALESLQFFFEYQDNGYAAAQEKYYKLYDYVTLKKEGQTYLDVLEYVGIPTYEDDELYDDAINFMKNFGK